jgi:hypothetical protein
MNLRYRNIGITGTPLGAVALCENCGSFVQMTTKSQHDNFHNDIERMAMVDEPKKVGK